MIPPQTSQVFFGIIVALLYSSAVTGSGVLILRAIIGPRSRAAIDDRLGFFGFTWLGFVIGQGTLSVAWLMLALAGVFYPWPIWIFCVLGWLIACFMVLRQRHHVVKFCKTIPACFFSSLYNRSWYVWVACGMVAVSLLFGAIALLPTGIDDALQWYLVVPKVIASHHRLEFLPFLVPYYGLLPLQVEMHWAALFAISHETAVTVWDYLCALSFLAGIGFLAWALTWNRSVALIAVLMMLSTSGFYSLMGGGKADNAAAQYGITALLWVVLAPALGRRAILLAGLCMGWMIGSRYTNAIFLPALIVFGVMVIHRAWRESAGNIVVEQLKKSWLSTILIAGIAAGIAVAPALIKNWLLAGCPLAPLLGCQDTVLTAPRWIRGAFWIFNRQGISILDLLSYPLVWTFGHFPDQLGNISPLFLGLLPFFLLYYRSPIVRSGFIAGVTGLISIALWWLLINRMFPYTRWVLVPLALLAVSLSSSVVAAEHDTRRPRTARWLIRGVIGIIVVFLLFQGRGVVYAIRYVASTDTRQTTYESMPGYDVAAWLNNHVQSGQRVALRLWRGYRYFLDPDHLLRSESAMELEQLWQRYGDLSPIHLYSFYATNGFDYVVVPKHFIVDALAALSNRVPARVVFSGRNDAVLMIEKH